ncbi:MAG: hypothetical protein IJD06_08210 [Clostridia bacterium]|nr:hypothetical protein [Clostridia bacterium]
MENAAVIHKVYGRGIVTAREEKTIRIQFEKEGVGEKSFVYPDAFCGFLQFEDGQLMSRVRGELQAIRLAEEERARERAAERAAYLEEEKQRQKELAAVKRKSAAKRPVHTAKKETAVAEDE